MIAVEEEEAGGELAVGQQTCGEAGGELPDPLTVTIGHPVLTDVPRFSLDVSRPRGPAAAKIVGLCEKDPRGGGLSNQIAYLRSSIELDQKMVIVRSTRFGPRSKTADYVSQLEAEGHACVIVEEMTWQTMQAVRTFLATRVGGFAEDAVTEWRRTDGPALHHPARREGLHIRRLQQREHADLSRNLDRIHKRAD